MTGFEEGHAGGDHVGGVGRPGGDSRMQKVHVSLPRYVERVTAFATQRVIH
jgi:hypothetical protein